MKKIFHDIEELKLILPQNKFLVSTSMGADPLHSGHVRCIQESSKIAKEHNGLLVIIVNGDDFLIRKKGKPFMLHDERMEIIAALEGVDYVVGWNDSDQTVCGALEILQPNIFTKGGDRSSAENVPEFEVCQKMGCQVIFGVGGKEKIQSSSDLIRNVSS